jgi:hypothetical protein
VLAAGMGSRYGGLKQMDRIGVSGETLLDYAVFDALRSGFGKIVFIIRRGIEKDFNDIVITRMNGKVQYDIVFQEFDSLIPAHIAWKDRVKPWGTTHALLCAEASIDAPFAVINADDFYSRAPYTVLGEYLSSSPDISEGAIVPFKLVKTLSAAGSVTRGVCNIKDGYLLSVEELLSIKQEGNNVFNTEPDGSKRELSPDTPVSLNFWGFPTSIFGALRDYFNDFLAEPGLKPNSECYIPKAVDHLIRTGALTCRAINADSEWFGVTYAEDRAAVSRHIAELTAAGLYPASLWDGA